MKEEIIKKLKALIKTYDENKTWHLYSEKEANAMKNYNKGINDAIAIVQQEL